MQHAPVVAITAAQLALITAASVKLNMNAMTVATFGMNEGL